MQMFLRKNNILMKMGIVRLVKLWHKLKLKFQYTKWNEQLSIKIKYKSGQKTQPLYDRNIYI